MISNVILIYVMVHLGIGTLGYYFTLDQFLHSSSTLQKYANTPEVGMRISFHLLVIVLYLLGFFPALVISIIEMTLNKKK